MNKRIFILAAFILAFGLLPVLAQEQTDETQARVPELEAFHDIIYPIWHTAYPDKDYAALRGYATEVKSLAGKILEAKLPGILREKQEKWEAGLIKFKSAVEDYATSASTGADEAVWNAAEVLHAHYEMLVRLIRPVLKEVDDFHRELYVLYHKHLPGKDFTAIQAAAPVLAEKAEALRQAVLPKRLESRQEAFRQAAAALQEAVKILGQACTGAVQSDMESAVNQVHARYQALEKVFD
jgi:hypothetical protein